MALSRGRQMEREQSFPAALNSSLQKYWFLSMCGETAFASYCGDKEEPTIVWTKSFLSLNGLRGLRHPGVLFFEIKF